MRTSFLLASFLAFFSTSALAASSSKQENTTTTLVSEHSAVSATEPFRLGLYLEPREGWHFYWENPGDSGLTPALTWSLPEGFTASAVDWPAPVRIDEGTLATYSYEKAALLPVTVTPPEGFTGKEIPVKLKAEILICHDICVPESAELDLTLPVGKPSHSKHTGLFSTHDKTRPTPLPQPGSFTYSGTDITLHLPTAFLGTDKEPPEFESAQFFPRQQNVLQYATSQNLSQSGKEITLVIPRAADGDKPETISGVLTLKQQDGNQRSYHASFTTAPAADENMLLPVALLLALAGGLVLNLMPCVLPVLSLKALALAKKAGGAQRHVARQGIAYTVGILLSFAAISGLLLALRAGGESVGWGYQMQSPAFVGALAYLLFLVGLSLSGVFHLPVLLGGIGHKLTSENSVKGSFFTGMLATAVATPCTAPFMAPAVGAALTMPAWQSLLVFQALGLGLAMPYLLISLFPPLRAFLPKPGAWMDSFKKLLAFPMYASVIWLLWVLTLQSGVEAIIMALSAMLAMLFVIWLKELFPCESRTYPLVAVALIAALLALTLPSFAKLEQAPAMPLQAAKQEVETLPYSPETLSRLRTEGKPVFVDATAAWCITCQVNARVALHTPRTMKKMKELGVVLLIADWTRRNPEISNFLASFGFNGVPLNVYYPPGQEPVVLPQLLSEEIIIKTITPKGE